MGYYRMNEWMNECIAKAQMIFCWKESVQHVLKAVLVWKCSTHFIYRTFEVDSSVFDFRHAMLQTGISVKS